MMPGCSTDSICTNPLGDGGHKRSPGVKWALLFFYHRGPFIDTLPLSVAYCHRHESPKNLPLKELPGILPHVQNNLTIHTFSAYNRLVILRYPADPKSDHEAGRHRKSGHQLPV
jgi:hypothetical protein